MAITLTTNFSFKKQDLGHPERDTFNAVNLDAIDAAIQAGVSPLTAAKIIVGSAENLAVGVVMSGDITISNAGVTAIGAGKVVLADLTPTLLKEVITVPMSFEANEETATKIYFPFKVTINKIRSIVMLAIAGTDDGTITGANVTGDSNAGVVTVAASSILNTEDEASPDSNNVVAVGGFYKLTSAKATDGGKVLVTLEYTRTA